MSEKSSTVAVLQAVPAGIVKPRHGVFGRSFAAESASNATKTMKVNRSKPPDFDARRLLL
jgi:hypothetical protein